jgi:hypothetical protein
MSSVWKIFRCGGAKALVGVFLIGGLAPATAGATQIVEQLVASGPNTFSGTFLITPSTPTWAFGVGNDDAEDTSISGIAYIDGLEANDHWISSIISRASWESGFNFDSIRPIGATAPSSFAIDTASTAWQWGSSNQVAFYWLSEAGIVPSSPLAVLQAGNQYDAFKFFTSTPASPFAAFGAADGGTITTGETIVVPEPSTALLLGAGLSALAAGWRRPTRQRTPGPLPRNPTGAAARG